MSNDRYTVQGYSGDVHTLVSADYHRNGSGGDGFYVALVDTLDQYGEADRFLLTWFPEYTDDDSETLADRQTAVSVLSVAKTAAGNIHMYPGTDPATGETLPGTGGAAYRGADNWDKVIPLIRLYLDDERAMRDKVFQADLASRVHAQ